MMGTLLHHTLRNLCFNTEWKYAVFWKLTHRARMMLTWEDAYYDNHGQHDLPENKHFSETLNNLHDGHYLHDPLGLAVAKMSYHVYSLGEGTVGQVAVTGQHRWIFADKHATNTCASFECSDGWQTQFSAGIKTVVVVAVVPHGVVQLGSLNKVLEDFKLVIHIRKVFCALQDSSVAYIHPSPTQCSMNNSQPDISTASSCSEVFHDCLLDLDKDLNKKRLNAWSPLFPSAGRCSNGSSYVVPLPLTNLKRAVEVINKHGELELSTSRSDETVKLIQPRSEVLMLDDQKQMQAKLPDDKRCEVETGGSNEGVVSKQNDTPYLHSFSMDNNNNNNLYNPVDKSGGNFVDFPFDRHNSAACFRVKDDHVDCHKKGVLHIPGPSDMLPQEELQSKLEFQSSPGNSESLNSFLKFSAGCELHEALGSAFPKQGTYCEWETGKISGTTFEMPETISTCQPVSDFGSDDLLEAVVANVCHSDSDIKSEKSFCQSMQSLLTTEKMPEPSIHPKHTAVSAGYSIDQSSFIEEDAKQCLTSSEVSGVKSSKGFSSTCPSACSEQLERSQEPIKTKKRARPGESCRPRPRDRQLIQDRIKELRELVPNGSKCSIDSLLERTVKHMLFLQSITKHADKLKECAESKLRNKDTGMLGSSTHEQGSSWAVEVGNQPKVCPIVVENLNVHGQILVEMLCEECCHFLEIAEAIRSLGLTILKGVTEARGEKTWICFVVEGQNNRSMHRMDILWSLVQILQPKAVV